MAGTFWDMVSVIFVPGAAFSVAAGAVAAVSVLFSTAELGAGVGVLEVVML